ncbi:putative RNA recognition motif domain, nucleotide-binding alpha-beta plait domain superfamily [Helianthus annuus]|nr:putative RNA recognition motif domain, nucleotide-binding alpha-beta plait domain superfamily [Helianthus annuus]
METRRKPIPESIQRRILKLFVTNIPEGGSGADLASFIRPFGQIFDLYIARKRDKNGNHFGFISMLDIKDKDDLLRNLRNIHMGNCKLWFNIARFVLEDGEINSFKEDRPVRDDGRNKRPVEDKGKTEIKIGTSDVGDRSFKDMLVGKSIYVDSNVNGFASMHGHAVVARFTSLSALKNGVEVLISFSDATKAFDFVQAAVLHMDRFTNIALWEGQSLGFERLAWLKVQGIPLHLLTNEIIDSVGGLFGRIVHGATRSENDLDLSVEFVAVLVGDGKRISEEIVINWRDRKFRVWVSEEHGAWIPEFLEPEFESSPVEEEDMDAEVNVKQLPEKEVDNHVGVDNFEDAGSEDENVDNSSDCETDGDDINCIDDSQSMPLNVNKDISEDANDDFIPEIDFLFEAEEVNGGDFEFGGSC